MCTRQALRSRLVLRDARKRAPQRLCSSSSGLPLFLVPELGVEDGEDFTRDGDEGDHLGLSSGQQASIEGLELRMMPAGREGGHVESRAQRSSSAANLALAFPAT